MTKGNAKLPKILIVDDEQISRGIISSILEGIGNCRAVDSGIKALGLVSKAIRDKNPYDLLILDISMPHMNGIEVLTKIRKNEYKNKVPKPERIKTIIVTGTMRMSVIKACLKLGCNGFLSKPFSPALLFRDMERVGFNIPAGILRESPHQEKFSQLVGDVIRMFNSGKIKLPVLSHITQEVQSLLNESTPAIDELVKIIEKDAVITAELISVVNSSFFKGVDKIDNLNESVVRLGLKETLSIVLALTSKNLFKSENTGLEQFMNKLWNHALACALGARLIAQHLELENCEEIFLMGIVHDIGKNLLLAAVADLSPDQSLHDENLHEAIGLVHTTFGAVLLEKMKFSKKFALVTELHHWSSFPKDSDTELLIIHLANAVALNIGFNSSFSQAKQTDIDFSSLESFKMLNLEDEIIKDICQKTKASMAELAAMTTI